MNKLCKGLSGTMRAWSGFKLTSKNWKPPHCGEGVISRCIQNVQLVNFSPDAVEFPVEILNGRRVLVIEPLVQKPRDDGGLPHFGGAQDHHPVAVLGRYVERVLGWRHFLNHACNWGFDSGGGGLNPLEWCEEGSVPAICELALEMEERMLAIYGASEPRPHPPTPMRHASCSIHGEAAEGPEIIVLLWLFFFLRHMCPAPVSTIRGRYGFDFTHDNCIVWSFQHHTVTLNNKWTANKQSER